MQVLEVRLCELCSLPRATSMLPFTPPAWEAAFMEAGLFPGPFISCGLVAQVERWIHSVIRLLEKTVQRQGRKNSCRKSQHCGFWFCITLQPRTSAQGSATVASAQVVPSVGAFQVNGLCYSVNNYPHIGSIFSWVSSSSSTKWAFDFDSSGNQACTGALERDFPCTSRPRKYIWLYSLYLVWFAALSHSAAIRWLESHH